MNATIEGEQVSDTVSRNPSGDTSSANTDDLSGNPDDTSVNTDGSTGSGGASEGSQMSFTNEANDERGASSSRQQLPHARIWTRDHTPDLIIGNPDAGVN